MAALNGPVRAEGMMRRCIVMGAVLAGVLAGCGTSSSSSGDDALVQRTCEIFRDIAGDYSDGVDTLPETRDRLRDLLNGYGEAAPSDISQPLRAIVAGLTQGDIDSATDGIG